MKLYSLLWIMCIMITEETYKRVLEREKTTDNAFSSQFIKPIGSIWPRSYSRPGYLFFDENGAAFNVRPDRPTLQEILAVSPFGYSTEGGEEERRKRYAKMWEMDDEGCRAALAFFMRNVIKLFFMLSS